MVIYLVMSVPKTELSSNYNNTNTSLYSLDQAIISQAALFQMASQAAVAIYTIDYLNYKDQLQQMTARILSPQGWSIISQRL